MLGPGMIWNTPLLVTTTLCGSGSSLFCAKKYGPLPENEPKEVNAPPDEVPVPPPFAKPTYSVSTPLLLSGAMPPNSTNGEVRNVVSPGTRTRLMRAPSPSPVASA